MGKIVIDQRIRGFPVFRQKKSYFSDTPWGTEKTWYTEPYQHIHFFGEGGKVDDVER
jgi:hypothetical protein